MIENLFLITVLLSITGSIGYVLFKLSVVICDNYLSQNWRYHGIMAISMLFILPIYKLWAVVPMFYSYSSKPAFSPIFLTANANLSLQQVSINAHDNKKPILSLIAVLWFLVAISLIFWNIWKLLRYCHLIRLIGSKADKDLKQLALEEAHFLGIYSDINLLVLPLIQSPMLIGFFHPTILLPSSHLSDSDARFIFKHELTHFWRKDLWKKLLILLIQCIHWFNPIAYLLNKNFVYCMETSCDEQVVRHFNRSKRKEYGYLLINYTPTSRHTKSELYISFASCRYKLERRIAIMLNSNKSHSPLGAILAIALIIGCIATTSFVAANDAEQADDKEYTTMLDTEKVWVIPTEQASGKEHTTMLDTKKVWVVPAADEIDTSNENQSLADDTVTDMGIMPLAEGDLAAHSGYSYGSIAIGKGQTLTVSATYTPTNVKMQIGYMNSNGQTTYANISGGYGTNAFKISKAGTYKIYIYNPSKYNVKFNVSYIVD